MTRPLVPLPAPPCPRWPVIALALWAAACAGFLLLGENPWTLDLAARTASGEPIRLEEFVREGFGFAAAFHLAAALGLLLSARWWLAPAAGSRAHPTPAPEIGHRFHLALLGILVIAAWLRAPALDHSLWNDEEYTLRRYVWGAWKVESDECLRWRPNGWATTLWFNRGANNHVAFSIPAKISLLAWQRATGARPGDFSEAALRFPAFVLGLGSIALVAVCLAVRGLPLAGLVASAVLALHPWHLRYSTEARGYASLLFFSLLATHLLDRALREDRWRHWLGFAAAQALFLYSFPGAIYLAATLNAGALVALWRRRVDPDAVRTGPFGRLIAANTFAAMAFVLAMAPCFRQIALYLQRDIARGRMGADWALDVWCHVAAGIRWPPDPPGEPLWTTASALIHQPLFAGAVFGLLPVLALGGLWSATRRGLGLFVAPGFAAALLAYLHTAATGNFLFSWYLVFVLPALAVGIASVFGCSSIWSLLAAALCVSVWAAATHVPRCLIRDHDRQPLRAVAVRLRGAPLPLDQDPRPVTVAIGTSAGQFRSYDPRIVWFDRDADPGDLPTFDAIVARARSEDRPLRVVLCGRSKEERVNAAMVARATDPARFRLTGRVNGVEELFSFEIYEPLEAGP